MIDTNSSLLKNWLIQNSGHIALIALLCGMALSLFLQAISFFSLSSNGFETVPEETANRHQVRLLQEDDYPMIFGEFSAKNQGNAMPDTRLQLTLLGTLIDTSKGKSSAIIQNSAGNSKLYRIGDNLENGAVLTDIHPKYIVIFYQDIYQKLRYPEKQKSLIEKTETGRQEQAKVLFSKYYPLKKVKNSNLLTEKGD